MLLLSMCSPLVGNLMLNIRTPYFLFCDNILSMKIIGISYHCYTWHRDFVSQAKHRNAIINKASIITGTESTLELEIDMTNPHNTNIQPGVKNEKDSEYSVHFAILLPSLLYYKGTSFRRINQDVQVLLRQM